MVDDHRGSKESFFWIKSGSDKIEQSKQSKQQNKIENRIPEAKPPKRKQILNSNKAGLKQGWIRATFIVKEDNLMKIKALAYWERKEIKEIIDNAFEAFLAGKDIKPIDSFGN